MAVIETSENAKDLAYQTHYYKASYAQVKKVYLELVESLNHTIVSENDDYHEIYSEVPHFTVIAKIIEQTPIETSIDFYINAIQHLLMKTARCMWYITRDMQPQVKFTM